MNRSSDTLVIKVSTRRKKDEFFYRKTDSLISIIILSNTLFVGQSDTILTASTHLPFPFSLPFLCLKSVYLLYSSYIVLAFKIRAVLHRRKGVLKDVLTKLSVDYSNAHPETVHFPLSACRPKYSTEGKDNN